MPLSNVSLFATYIHELGSTTQLPTAFPLTRTCLHAIFGNFPSHSRPPFCLFAAEADIVHK